VSHRPLVLVSGLTLSDYLLWNWSLNGNHDVLALVSGLTLPPLGVACLWLLALSAMRVIAHYGRLPLRRSGARDRSQLDPAAGAVATSLEEPVTSTAAGGRSSGKLAA
jgi:hypothetical protein